MKRKVNPEAIDYLEGRAEITDEQFNEWFVENANPYYTRSIQERMATIDILKMAKANGCECYVTPGDDIYTYGYMIFPDDDVVMYIQRGDFWGWDFSIPYIPSRENGTGCRCNDESLSTVTWEDLLKQKAEGLKFARKLKAKQYGSSEEWKRNYWRKDEMVRL